MGAQNSIMRSCITSLSSKDKRGFAYGIFGATFGTSWFVGSLIMGAFYDVSILVLVVISVISQLIAVPFLYRAFGTYGKRNGKLKN
jgi:MFS-type transporter involved in bile tolerance (Atg22 family)